MIYLVEVLIFLYNNNFFLIKAPGEIQVLLLYRKGNGLMLIECRGVVLSGYVPDLPINSVRRCGMQRLF